MDSRTILLVADEVYLDHARSMLVGCRIRGEWEGDFCLLCSGDSDTSGIEGRGIEIVRAPEPQWTNAIKFRMFAPHFRKWDQVLYLDCDILIQGNLNEACDSMAPKLPSIMCDDSSLNSSILDDWKHFDALAGSGMESHPEVYKLLRERFPHIDSQIMASSAMFFAPDAIADTTVDDLFDIQREFAEANPGSYDQQVINLLLYDQMAGMGKDICTWFPFDDPGNRVPSEARGWTGDESPAILHYWGAFAPWLEKTPDAGAYFNHRIGKPCREIWLENLAAFDETFPMKG